MGNTRPLPEEIIRYVRTLTKDNHYNYAVALWQYLEAGGRGPEPNAQEYGLSVPMGRRVGTTVGRIWMKYAKGGVDTSMFGRGKTMGAGFAFGYLNSLRRVWGSEWDNLPPVGRKLVLADYVQATEDDNIGGDEYLARIGRGNLLSYAQTLEAGARRKGTLSGDWPEAKRRRMAESGVVAVDQYRRGVRGGKGRTRKTNVRDSVRSWPVKHRKGRGLHGGPQPRRAPTIYDIKRANPEGYYFSTKTMRFFGQTLKSFMVRWNSERDCWETTAAIHDRDGKYQGNSVHYWHADTLKSLPRTAMAGATAEAADLYNELDADGRELVLFIENDGDLYRQQGQPIQKNLVGKMARGVFDEALAAKLYMYYVENGAKKYVREVAGSGTWHTMFTMPTRKAVAAYFAKKFHDEYDAGEHRQYMPKKYRKGMAGSGSRRRSLPYKHAQAAARGPVEYPSAGQCECADPGCPVHPGRSICHNRATTKVSRIDMEPRTTFRMCEGCASDALDSGVFA